MLSLRKRFDDINAELDRLAPVPVAVELDALAERVALLDDELRAVIDDEQRYELNKLSAHANATLGDRLHRLGIARNIADAAHQREIHDALHPTILSPQLPTMDDLGWDGFDR